MKDPLFNKIVMCDICHVPFIINCTGTDTTCDECIDSLALSEEPVIDETIDDKQSKFE